MKRLFPRAVPHALVALTLLGASCSPDNSVKPGAPVIISLALIEPSAGNVIVEVTPTTMNCPATYAEGKSCDPMSDFAVCELGGNVVCQCNSTDMCDPHAGSLNCTFPPTTRVKATFDRLIDTTPFEAMTPVATLVGVPATTATAATDYTSTGSSTGLVFTNWNALTGGGLPNINGPTIVASGAPAMPTLDTVTVTFDKTLVLAKDKKTPYTGAGPLLVDGKIAFKTSDFEATVTVPAPPAMDMGGSTPMMMCPPPATDAGADAGSNADGGVADGGSDAGATSDAGTTSDAGADAATATPPAASTDVPADMNMGAVTIDFTNTVDMTVLAHITFTEDGQPFTAVTGPDPAKDLPATELKYTPKTAWAPGKTYTVTIDKDAADVLGAKLVNAPVTAIFTMAK